MKSVLVIGMGRFGRHLARKMQDLGNEVMIVDKDPLKIEPFSNQFSDSQIGDCTNKDVCEALEASQFDICFVTIGEDFQSSLVITSLLKSFGAKMVVSKANQEIQADLLRKIGADEVVYPEREMAEKLAVRFAAKNIFDYVPLTGEYSIYEIPVVPSWAGQSIADLNIRRKYRINIIAVKHDTQLAPMPGPDHIFRENDHLVVIGRSEDVFKLTART